MWSARPLQKEGMKQEVRNALKAVFASLPGPEDEHVKALRRFTDAQLLALGVLCPAETL